MSMMTTMTSCSASGTTGHVVPFSKLQQVESLSHNESRKAIRHGGVASAFADHERGLVQEAECEARHDVSSYSNRVSIREEDLRTCDVRRHQLHLREQNRYRRHTKHALMVTVISEN